MRFTDEQLAIVRFCAIECELQGSGERSVEWMLWAWVYAQQKADLDPLQYADPTEADVLALGAIIEPTKNLSGYRQIGVMVGWDIKPDWSLVPDQMTDLMSGIGLLDPAEAFRRFEEVHPFRDGNGRVGTVLFNMLAKSLDAPTWPPNFWNDPRRKAGHGA